MERIKKRVFQIISKAEKGDRASAVFDWTIMILIVLSILTIILDSFKSIHDRYEQLFKMVNFIEEIMISEMKSVLIIY